MIRSSMAWQWGDLNLICVTTKRSGRRTANTVDSASPVRCASLATSAYFKIIISNRNNQDDNSFSRGILSGFEDFPERHREILTPLLTLTVVHPRHIKAGQIHRSATAIPNFLVVQFGVAVNIELLHWIVPSAPMKFLAFHVFGITITLKITRKSDNRHSAKWRLSGRLSVRLETNLRGHPLSKGGNTYAYYSYISCIWLYHYIKN